MRKKLVLLFSWAVVAFICLASILSAKFPAIIFLILVMLTGIIFVNSFEKDDGKHKTDMSEQSKRDIL